MKCPHCGAPLKMEDKFCTYCGAPNTLALQHQADMEHYEQEFAETQEEVIKKSRKAGSLTGFLIVLIVLIVLNVAAAIVGANTWNIKYERRKAEASRHIEEYKKEIEEMIADQNYIALSSYYYNNNLSGTELLDEYDAIRSYAGKLSDIYMYLCTTNHWSYNYEEDRIDTTVSYIAEDIIKICEDPRSNYYTDSAVTEDKLNVIRDIKHQMEALLVAYAGFTEEEALNLENMSKARIKEALKENLGAMAKEQAEAEAAEEAAKAEAEAEKMESFDPKEYMEQLMNDAEKM